MQQVQNSRVSTALTVRIRRYRPQNAEAVAALISRTYSRFNHAEGTRQAVRQYVDDYKPTGNLDSIRKRFERTPQFFVAFDEHNVVGVVRGFGNRIVNLFVEGAYHRRGIATRLMHRFEAACRAAGEEEIVVRSSLYAVSFYENLGYKKTTGVRNLHGLKVQPMKKKL